MLKNTPDEWTKNIQKLSCDEIKNYLLYNGFWPQYVQRIKNLELVQEELWKIYKLENDLEKKLKILEDVANLQPVIANCYACVKNIFETETK